MQMRRRALLLALAATPAYAQTPRPQPIDQLFAALRLAPNEPATAAVEARILALWDAQASPAVRLLLARGTRELGQNAPSNAFDSFDAALDLQPDLIAAWRGRAVARMRLGDATGAVHDFEQTLQREPRDFAALSDLSQLAGSRQDWPGALAAWQRVLAIAPNTPGGAARLADLRRRAFGDPT